MPRLRDIGLSQTCHLHSTKHGATVTPHPSPLIASPLTLPYLVSTLCLATCANYCTISKITSFSHVRTVFGAQRPVGDCRVGLWCFVETRYACIICGEGVSPASGKQARRQNLQWSRLKVEKTLCIQQCLVGCFSADFATELGGGALPHNSHSKHDSL